MASVGSTGLAFSLLIFTVLACTVDKPLLLKILAEQPNTSQSPPAMSSLARVSVNSLPEAQLHFPPTKREFVVVVSVLAVVSTV